ncbi:hypothetical protein [Embleya sp. NPDC059237]|uniref:hypothetical protein n=1 Tax=Embleya sp. NPDC059237 TaxID=3346784 RepID=UPI0036962B50
MGTAVPVVRVEVIRIDNGARFRSVFYRPLRHRHRPHPRQSPPPRLEGRGERCHGIDAEEFHRLLDGVVIDDARVLDDELREWEAYCDHPWPHGGRTPYERLERKTASRT